MGNYLDKKGNLHRIDRGGNHFIDGKCVNPIWDGKFSAKVGSTYKDLEVVAVPEGAEVLGHIPNFVYFDRNTCDKNATIRVETGHPAW